MDKLHWFKFAPSDWMMGKIQRCSEITQARFIRLCCIYWNKETNMSIDDAICEIDQDHFDELIKRKIITENQEHIFIDFLDDQMDEIMETSRKNSKAGKISAQRRAEKRQQQLNERSTSVQRNPTDKKRTDKKRKEEKRKDKEKGIIFPFDTLDFLKWWDLWKEYKKNEHKFQYKSKISEQAALKKISELANNDEQTAIEIIEQSIANGYKGLFKLKENNNEKNQRNNKKGASGDEIASILSNTFGKKE